MKLEEIEKEAEQTWNFHRSHNNGVMAVSEAKKLVDKLLTYIASKESVNGN